MNSVVYKGKGVKKVCLMNNGEIFICDGDYWMLTDSVDDMFNFAVNLKNGKLKKFGPHDEYEVCAGKIEIMV